MSGVMAILSLDGSPVPPELTRAQLAAIAHRGEWEPRLWEGEGIALGHANMPRTPEAEREFLPACDSTGRYWITWDGRLDNRDELARLLGLDRDRAAEMTDADYVLVAYRTWGDDCVLHLLGDWAVVIWDNVARRLFVAKDPVGYRQLFRRTWNGFLIVGSEPLQLFAGTGDTPTPDREYTLRYLAGAVQDEDRNWFEGVSNIHGGERIAASESGIRSERYWTHPRITPRPYKRPQEYVEEFKSIFEDAVRAQLRSNRPIGIYLSGGLDSSYIAAIIAKLGSPFVALNAYDSGGTLLDERHYARMVANHLGVDLQEVDISDCWSISSRWIPDSALDSPFVPGQGASQIRLGELMRQQGVGVVFGGQGGDECFTGPDYYLASAVASGQFRSAWRLARLNRSRRRALRTLLKQCYRGLAPHQVQAAIDTLRRKPSPDGDRPVVPLRDGWEDMTWHRERVLAWSTRTALRADWEAYRQDLWLEVSWRDRHEAHRYRIDRRQPLLDLRIVEFMASVPPWYQRFRGRPKDLLREAEYDVLPREIPDRMDSSLYDDLFHRGMRAETERIRTAEGALRDFLNLRFDLVATLSSGAEEQRVHWPASRALTTGLWLANLRAPEPLEKIPLELSSV